jgi:rod shape-determining protein MreD
MYFGLNSFSFLLIFIVLKAVSHRLYTDSRVLMVLGAFLASICNGFLNLLMLAVFSLAPGMYSTVLSVIIPQSLVNALIAYLVFSIVPLGKREEIP